MDASRPDRLAMVTSGTLRIQIRLLGLVEVSLDGRRVSLGGSKQRALLALLALNVNAPVSTSSTSRRCAGCSRAGTA